MICLHRSFREGGDLPAGRWCEGCGARLDRRRGSPAELAVARKQRERRAARQIAAVQLELLRRRPPC